jgi:hypothetical protein
MILNLNAKIYLWTNIGWLNYVHNLKIDNNKVEKNINPKPNTPKIVVWHNV